MVERGGYSISVREGMSVQVVEGTKKVHVLGNDASSRPHELLLKKLRKGSGRTVWELKVSE